MATHYLKTWPDEFGAIRRGEKTFDLRDKIDRNFQVGDILSLQEWDVETQLRTGEEELVRVTYILEGGRFGLPEHLCVMAIKQLVYADY